MLHLRPKTGISSSVKGPKACYSKGKIDISLAGLIAGRAIGKHVSLQSNRPSFDGRLHYFYDCCMKNISL